MSSHSSILEEDVVEDVTPDSDELANTSSPKMSAKASAFSIDALMSSTPTKNQDNVPKKRTAEVLHVSPGSDKKRSKLVDKTSTPSSPTDSPVDDSTVQCRLDNKELWSQFHELGTEMIITKSGRRMFPVIRVSFGNLEPDERYLVIMDVLPVDRNRYRYAYHRSAWMVAGKGDPELPSRIYIHPDSPFTGEQLIKQTVSFEKLKLTNNVLDKHYIVLNSMHKYQPRVHVVKVSELPPALADAGCGHVANFAAFEHLKKQTFVFKETDFIGVTAYQNQLITKLKIDRNPFAKGFRDSSRLTDYERESMEQLLAHTAVGSISQMNFCPDNPHRQSSPDAEKESSSGHMELDARSLLRWAPPPLLKPLCLPPLPPPGWPKMPLLPLFLQPPRMMPYPMQELLQQQFASAER